MFQKNPGSAQVLHGPCVGWRVLPSLLWERQHHLVWPSQCVPWGGCHVQAEAPPHWPQSPLTGQCDGRDSGGHRPSPGPPQPGSVFSWRRTLHSFLQFSVLYSHLKNTVEVNQVLPSVSFAFVTLVTKGRIRKRLNPNYKSLVAPLQLRPTPKLGCSSRKGVTSVGAQDRVHPNIYHSGMLIILNLSYLRNNWYKRDTPTLSSVSPKAGNRSLIWKVPSLHLKVEGGPHHQRWGIWGLEVCIYRSCSSFNLLLQAQTLFRVFNWVPKNLNFLVLSISHKFIVYLSTKYKSCLLWPLVGFHFCDISVTN